ncbi:hypothetical protein EMIT0P171_90032 [Pseudomonas sp. IT-P171]
MVYSGSTRRKVDTFQSHTYRCPNVPQYRKQGPAGWLEGVLRTEYGLSVTYDAHMT